MKSCTPTTVFTNCIQNSPDSKPITPNAFSDFSPKRSHSSELKIKHPNEIGRIINLFRQQKRCVSVHKLGIKSPISRSPKISQKHKRNTDSTDISGEVSRVKSISPQKIQVNKTINSPSTVSSEEIQNTVQFKKWIKVKNIKTFEEGNGILQRFNGQRRKVKINVKHLQFKLVN